MHERKKNLIVLAQKGDKEALAQIIEENRRINMEYCKKICRKRL